jgi:sugar phosphate permease
LILGHHGHCVLSGAMFAMGWPTGSRSHVASHSRSEAGRWRCLWNISSQLTCPTLGMVSVLGSLGAWDRSTFRSREMGGIEAIVSGVMFSIFLHAERPLRRGSIASRMLRR